MLRKMGPNSDYKEVFIWPKFPNILTNEFALFTHIAKSYSVDKLSLILNQLMEHLDNSIAANAPSP